MSTNQITALYQSLKMQQRITIGVVVVVVAAGLYGLQHFEREGSFRPLFTDMAAEDAGPVVDKLKEEGVPYRLLNGGGTIAVPDDRVAELRLEMAGAGLPKTGRLGFELFDKTNFGITDFAEHVNYRRALEGELERSVMSVAEIEQARVHISLPEESVFTESKQPAKASVLIKIRRGATLPDSAIPAITNLVASAVEGLSPESVAVLDMRGNLLSRPKRPETQDDSSASSLEYRQKVEHDLAAKLDSTLEPLVGAGRFRTAVSADCEMKSGEQSEETFDPEHSVMVNSQKTEDISNQTRAPEGVPGTASTLPDNSPRPSAGATTSRKTENVTYQSSHTVKRMTLPQGEIQRLSVSVLLDYDVSFEGNQRILNPPSADRLKVIHDLVAAAVGLHPDRGDQLIVETLPFESTMNLEPPPQQPAAKKAPKAPLQQVKENPKMMTGAAAVAVLLIVGCFFAFAKTKRVRKPSATVSGAPQLPPPPAPAPKPAAVGAAQPAAAKAAVAAAGAADTRQVAAPETGGEFEASHVALLTTQVRAVTQQNAEICAGILRGWLKEEGA